MSSSAYAPSPLPLVFTFIGGELQSQFLNIWVTVPDLVEEVCRVLPRVSIDRICPNHDMTKGSSFYFETELLERLKPTQ